MTLEQHRYNVIKEIERIKFRLFPFYYAELALGVFGKAVKEATKQFKLLNKTFQ